ncbi:hypothetical protein, partial [Escherichia coli]|uniref:hypothetical protein n=1 Tax=Escherichia coli TaxID=562 RepID=UPI002023930A
MVRDPCGIGPEIGFAQARARQRCLLRDSVFPKNRDNRSDPSRTMNALNEIGGWPVHDLASLTFDGNGFATAKGTWTSNGFAAAKGYRSSSTDTAPAPVKPPSAGQKSQKERP